VDHVNVLPVFVKVVVVDIQNRGSLNPQEHPRDTKLTRQLCDPGKHEGVGDAGERFAFLFSGGYDVSQKLRAAALELGHVGAHVGVVGGFVTVVVAVGEGDEGEAGDGGFVEHATVEVDAGGESDVDANGSESLGILEGGVYVALDGVGYEEEVLLHHDNGGA